MHLRPLIEREWRFWQGRPWWSRPPCLLIIVFGGAGLLLAPMDLFSGAGPAPEDLFPFAYCFAMGAHIFSGGGAASIMAAETQAGSLHLLRLAGMRPSDLLLGQIASGLIVASWAALSLLPWLIAGWLHCGLQWIDLLWLALLWVLVGTAIHGTVAVVASFGHTISLSGLARSIGPLLVIFGSQALVAWLLPSGNVVMPRAQVARACAWLAAGSIVALATAFVRLARSEHRGCQRAAMPDRNRVGPRQRPAGAERRRLLDRNPIVWLGAGRGPRWAWLVLGLGLAVPWLDGEAGPGEVFAAACWTRGGLIILLAVQAFAQVRRDLRDGTWESVLRAPVSVDAYVNGHLLAWWRQHGGVLFGLVLIPSALALWLCGVTMLDGGKDALAMAFSGALVTAGDAALASVWLFAAAVKYADHEFYLASLLWAVIVALMQGLHASMGPHWGWAVLWVAMVSLVWTLSRATVVAEVRRQLAAAAAVGRAGLAG